MMMLPVNTLLAIVLATSLLSLGGCSENSAGDTQANKIKLWVAPNEAQEAFWKIAVEKWNNKGIGMPVEFTTIPSTENSEKAILMALVAGSAPDISTNIFSGFAAQLAALKQLQDLAVLPGYEQLIEKRHMQKIMQGWEQEGKQYVLPLYSNPTLIWWRQDILLKLGITTVPKTFDDVYVLSEKYARTEQKFGMQVISGKKWENRWFDFIPLYYATANGAPYIKGGKAIYDNPAGLAVLTFINTIFKNSWSAFDFDSGEPLVSGLVVGAVKGPWDIALFEKTYPETMQSIVIGPMITQYKNVAKTHTFADTKGMVLFKHSKVKAQAFAFISWILSDDELSLLWLEKTGLPPARGDLTKNPIFTTFYDHHPLAKQYADYVDVAIPPAFIESTIDVQKTMGYEMVEPMVFDTKNPQAALRDAVKHTDKILSAAQ